MSKILFALVLAAEAAATPQSNCSPKQLVCNGFPCPPCEPDGIRFATPLDKPASPILESYRLDLENFRKSVEERRLSRPSADASQYRESIRDYKDGIVAYRAAQPDRE